MESVPSSAVIEPSTTDPLLALDYPPFFAYFSYLLTIPAKFLPSRYAKHLLELSATPVDGWDIVSYMRISVLLSEVVLFWGLLRCGPAYFNTDHHCCVPACSPVILQAHPVLLGSNNPTAYLPRHRLPPRFRHP
jgi:hypothetical protein